jgi:hypothetical protein
VDDALGDDEPLPRPQLDHPAFQIDQQQPVHAVKEFVFVVVLVPVVLALNDAEADDRIVDLTQGLIVPTVGTTATSAGMSTTSRAS